MSWFGGDGKPNNGGGQWVEMQTYRHDRPGVDGFRQDSAVVFADAIGSMTYSTVDEHRTRRDVCTR